MNWIITASTFVVFIVIWFLFINRFLPSRITSTTNKEKKYDERQAIMITEVLARTLIWVVYTMIWNFILRLFGDNGALIISKQPEVFYIGITLLWLVISYLWVRLKYTSKG